ncbi:tRNA (adenosine(37)-N6)-threonylcarbamoyltransferase complex dimerization subunit type 1 TsaB [bacterium]|nr:tRNA (adenosine(37)-N6)-threonylcarbamoyltransferase complex dimerization subunit type 1 TsaB [bacterium]
MILSLDTSTARISLALWADGKLLNSKAAVTERRHNETILPYLESMLNTVNVKMRDIQGLVVGRGPGSFTGVRVGIATALGFAQALAIPVVGISSYLTIAAASTHSVVLVLGDARQDMVYAACYANQAAEWKPVFSEQLTTLSGLSDLLPEAESIAVTGPEAKQLFPAVQAKYPEFILENEEKHLPSAEIMARLAMGAIANPMQDKLQQGGMPVQDITPIYLRRTQAEEVRARHQH